ncbi:MAG TPA: GWxTD domain-containing protein, partial [Vicinamibacteria bacterium]
MRSPRFLLLFFAGLALVPVVPARAQKLDKEDKKFLDEVKPILLSDEEKTFKKLKDKADRQEFQKIFWARRDPDLDTPENEYRAEYEKGKTAVDAEYKVSGFPGSLNDCGRLVILMGKPDEVKKERSAESPGLRSPETWIYKDRPGYTFLGGQLEVALDQECRLPPGDFVKQLERVASNRVLYPNIDYRTGKDGKLTKLVDLLPKPSPARAVLKEPRQDFALEMQTMFLKVEDGGSAVFGVVRGPSAGLPVEEVGGRKIVRIVVAGSAADEHGKEAANIERKTQAEVTPDGFFAAAFRVNLRPGKYTMKGAALDEKGAKGSVAQSTVEVPNYGSGEMSLASLMLLRDVVDQPPGGGDGEGAFAPLLLGTAQLIPYGTLSLSKADNPTIVWQVYDLKVDEATGAPSGVATFSLLKGTKSVAEAPPVPIDKPVA